MLFEKSKDVNSEIENGITDLKSVFAGRVIFDHLSKTGGQAVNAWLRATLGTGCVSDNLNGTHRKLIKQFGGDYSIISGHIEFNGEGFDPRYDYVTCFRNPVERVVSWMYFIQHNFGTHDIVNVRNGVRNFIQTEGELGTEFIYSNQVTEHLCSIYGFSTQTYDQRLKYALKVVDEYALWGLHEHMLEFVNDFAAMLSVQPLTNLQSKNVTLGRPKFFELSPKLRAKIEEMNALDIALYEQLQVRYDKARQRWKRPVVSFSRWQPFSKKEQFQFCSPDFVLLTINREGGLHVSQNAVLTFKLEFSIARAVDALECGIRIHDAEQEHLVFITNSTLIGTPIGPLSIGVHVVSHTITTALPEGKYNVGFTFTEKRFSGDRDLAILDKMEIFQVNLERNIPCSGTVSLPVSISHRQLSQEYVTITNNYQGYLLYINPVSVVSVSEQWRQTIELHNVSKHDWHSLHLSPISLSYRWLNIITGQIVENNSLQTPLPRALLAAGERVQIEIIVQAPIQLGRYKLQVLPVVGNLGWSDALGFSFTELAVDVVSPSNTLRHYAANDCRLKSNVGQCTSASRISDGRDGFLCYGPYVPLPVGRYIICWTGWFDPRVGEVRVDVVVNVGMSLLANQSLSQLCTEVTLEIEVVEEFLDAEFRVWVSAGGKANVTDISIQPLSILKYIE